MLQCYIGNFTHTHTHTYVRFIVTGDTDMPQKNCCETLNIFIELTATQNTVFCFHCKNCCVKASTVTRYVEYL
jgi:hypothetical protein